jgi:hypothetical protein
MIESKILPAQDYNAILDLEGNHDQFLQQSSLIAIGEIFVKHGVASNFGVHLLHRHFPIPDGTIIQLR